ncbi:hypothetical protein F7230_04225 [Corynebacterium sp. 320]|uniref:hypothetical protein n=1 Tax=Corynebacterium TaxID=1716 RepID=UPI00125CA926|nr:MULTISPECIES: hypothetical protein [Corynebacterium]KAB1504294.1 hypothetical protein F7230_04225 [Corynebacterium sp. 320]KAB1552606.1 hypothetical protein F7233_02365 [Corynebacterium sp. 321]KAB1554176.1 hypothetical protein F7232_04220 [Corynebacterium sp. 319]KAB3528430.1 hypothetical protein F8354_04225 [Corynebacterium sp. 250]KAB3540080.1 hypothetical protein F8390_02110 [Corynebacterium sp. 366]
MKLKKSLLALSTAAAVAVAGTPAAFAADSDWGSLGANNNQTAATGQNNAGGSEKADQGANNNDTKNPFDQLSSQIKKNQAEKADANNTDGAGQNNNPGDPNKKSDLSSDQAKKDRKENTNKFFGWDDNTTGFQKFEAIGKLIATIVGIFTGLSSLNGVFEKIFGAFAK